jgi:hypothetical protein
MVTRLPGEAIESMGPSSVNEAHDRDGDPGSARTPVADSPTNPATNPAAGTAPNTAALLEQLQVDRAWLLQQIDSGRWPDLRLDLAALERELGQLLEQAQRRLGEG